VDSELGSGTSVRTYLRRIDAAAREIEPAPNVASVQGTETILIVEDDEAVSQLAVRVLRLAGYSVLTASSGAEAMQILERHGKPVHLVLTDIVMPGMSGPDLAAQLGEISPRTKIIFTSGYTDDSIVNQQLPGAAAHFIAKPYTTADLTRTVREVLDSRIVQAPAGR
jgi:two-component system cell cycle sensor histidine kinase/response regulator CckA